MTFSSVVGGVKSMDRTKTGCKVDIRKTNGPPTGAKIHFVTTVRCSKEESESAGVKRDGTEATELDTKAATTSS